MSEWESVWGGAIKDVCLCVGGGLHVGGVCTNCQLPRDGGDSIHALSVPVAVL